ncbi:MAG: hypothetical protein GF350_16920, partial [Chitinivibrionales bacterium]|nr:hypothetical protein [Chitinivibrionales bacterium]
MNTDKNLFQALVFFIMIPAVLFAQHDALDTIQAEDADGMEGVIGPPSYPDKVTSLIDSNYVLFSDVDFGTNGLNFVTANAVCVDNPCG